MFEAAVRRAGIGKLRFHELRYRFAARLAAAGVDVVAVKELLCHQDVSMTMRDADPAPQRSPGAARRLEHLKSITMGLDRDWESGSRSEPVSIAVKELALPGAVAQMDRAAVS
ncbi:MAG: tyrosine-type recombinase/integrase [Terriglobia bacterium]